MEARPEAVKACPRAMNAFSGAMEVRPGALEACPRAPPATMAAALVLMLMLMMGS